MRNGVIVSIKSQMKDVQSSLNRLFAHKTIIFWFSVLEINPSIATHSNEQHIRPIICTGSG